ncbi:MAG: hypothetical protein ABWK00_00990 [Desulfurococcaceae archaeon]
MIEGEILLYEGYAWIVKGFQHPPGRVIAYPRYDLVNRRKLSAHEALRVAASQTEFWDCLKLFVPQIPVESSTPLVPEEPTCRLASEAISEILDVDRDDVLISGSCLLGEYNDVDVIVLGANDGTLERLERATSRGIVGRASAWFSIEEYYRKHGALDAFTYSLLRWDRPTAIVINGVVVNVKMLSMTEGRAGCVDRVLQRRAYSGLINVLRPIRRVVLPALFDVLLETGERVIMETLRELYSDIRPGEYYVIGEVERRESGTYLVIDRGAVRAR